MASVSIHTAIHLVEDVYVLPVANHIKEDTGLADTQNQESSINPKENQRAWQENARLSLNQVTRHVHARIQSRD